jgi:cytochrome P450
MHINICATSVQLSQRYYGSNAADFDPSRWDASNASSFLAKNKGMQGLQAPGLESPAVHRPERGSYVAFSDGPRACLGRKFGQVVFVAVIATVLREFEVDFVVRESETRKMAEERVRGALKRSFATVTLGVSEEVRLVLRRRT